MIKLAGRVETDPATGQITNVFEQNPQLPFEDLKVDLFEGAKAPLRTPQTCGESAGVTSFTTTTSLVPWTAPEGATAHPSDSFSLVHSPAGGPCAATVAQLPDALSFEAGTVNPLAAAYSPFILKLSRQDGSQELKGLNVTLPAGPARQAGRHRRVPGVGDRPGAGPRPPGQGALEQASPSCPASSQLGTVTVGAGAGPSPFYAQGKAYLAGPYKGAPLSMEIVTPAVAGPFDLGVVAVRAALHVDPETARVTVVSDPIPTILQGIPLDVRSIAVNVDRPAFTLNPTSCDVMALSAEATSVTGQVAPLQNRFQVGGCEKLAFKPKLSLSLKGQTRRAGHPALRAVLKMPAGGYANIARAQVGLPHSEFLDQGNLNKVCTRPELKAQACPAKSIYGHVKAWTPLLEKPLEGPIYLGVGFGYKLPALVAELDGQIRVLLVGKVDTGKNKGIRNTFQTVPDAPVEKFELALKGGKKYGLLENSEDICKKKQQAGTAFTSQSGKVLEGKTTIQNSCGGGRTHKKGGKGGGGKRKGRGN